MKRGKIFGSASTMAGLVILLSGCGISTLNGQTQPNASAQQRQFCEQFGLAGAKYERLMQARDKEGNPLRREAIQKQISEIDPLFWNDQYDLIGPAGEFKDWEGKLGFRRAGREGFLVSVEACPGVYLNTGSIDGYGGRVENTTILLSSPLAQTLASYKPSQKARVSGTFVWGVKNMYRRGMHLIDQLHFVDTQFPSVSYRNGNLGLMVRFTAINEAR